MIRRHMPNHIQIVSAVQYGWKPQQYPLIPKSQDLLAAYHLTGPSAAPQRSRTRFHYRSSFTTTNPSSNNTNPGNSNKRWLHYSSTKHYRNQHCNFPSSHHLSNTSPAMNTTAVKDNQNGHNLSSSTAAATATTTSSTATAAATSSTAAASTPHPSDVPIHINSNDSLGAEMSEMFGSNAVPDVHHRFTTDAMLNTTSVASRRPPPTVPECPSSANNSDIIIINNSRAVNSVDIPIDTGRAGNESLLLPFTEHFANLQPEHAKQQQTNRPYASTSLPAGTASGPLGYPPGDSANPTTVAQVPYAPYVVYPSKKHYKGGRSTDEFPELGANDGANEYGSDTLASAANDQVVPKCTDFSVYPPGRRRSKTKTKADDITTDASSNAKKVVDRRSTTDISSEKASGTTNPNSMLPEMAPLLKPVPTIDSTFKEPARTMASVVSSIPIFPKERKEAKSSAAPHPLSSTHAEVKPETSSKVKVSAVSLPAGTPTRDFSSVAASTDRAVMAAASFPLEMMFGHTSATSASSRELDSAIFTSSVEEAQALAPAALLVSVTPNIPTSLQQQLHSQPATTPHLDVPKWAEHMPELGANDGASEFCSDLLETAEKEGEAILCDPYWEGEAIGKGDIGDGGGGGGGVGGGLPAVDITPTGVGTGTATGTGSLSASSPFHSTSTNVQHPTDSASTSASTTTALNSSVQCAADSSRTKATTTTTTRSGDIGSGMEWEDTLIWSSTAGRFVAAGLTVDAYNCSKSDTGSSSAVATPQETNAVKAAWASSEGSSAEQNPVAKAVAAATEQEDCELSLYLQHLHKEQLQLMEEELLEQKHLHEAQRHHIDKKIQFQQIQTVRSEEDDTDEYLQPERQDQQQQKKKKMTLLLDGGTAAASKPRQAIPVEKQRENEKGKKQKRLQIQMQQEHQPQEQKQGPSEKHEQMNMSVQTSQQQLQQMAFHPDQCAQPVSQYQHFHSHTAPASVSTSAPVSWHTTSPKEQDLNQGRLELKVNEVETELNDIAYEVLELQEMLAPQGNAPRNSCSRNFYKANASTATNATGIEESLLSEQKAVFASTSVPKRAKAPVLHRLLSLLKRRTTSGDSSVNAMAEGKGFDVDSKAIDGVLLFAMVCVVSIALLGTYTGYSQHQEQKALKRSIQKKMNDKPN